MNTPTPMPVDGDTGPRIRRGRVESVDLYEIKDVELDQFETGTPGDLQLNFAIFLLSTAFASFCSLVTATFSNGTIKNAFLFVTIIGVILGLYLILSWWRSRTSIKALCKRIRQRIPPDQLVVPADSVLDAEPDPDDTASPFG